MPQTLQANHAQDYVICVYPKRFAVRTYFYPIPQDISACFLDCKGSESEKAEDIILCFLPNISGLYVAYLMFYKGSHPHKAQLILVRLLALQNPYPPQGG